MFSRILVHICALGEIYNHFVLLLRLCEGGGGGGLGKKLLLSHVGFSVFRK